MLLASLKIEVATPGKATSRGILPVFPQRSPACKGRFVRAHLHVDAIDICLERVDETATYRHVGFEATQPFNALPLLPPRAKLETPQALKACIGARAALAELKALGGLIPNPSILINSIPRLEAQASSEIENIVTTGDRLFRFADAPSDNGVDPATKETLRYRTALARAFEALATRPLSTRTAVDICTTIKGVQMDVRRGPANSTAEKL